MMAGGLYFVSTRLGDIVGNQLYDSFGNFTVCVGLMMATSACILLILKGLPGGRQLGARAESA